MADTIERLGSVNPKVAMVGKGFAKYMRRSPMSDEEITQALRWIQDEINGILNGSEPIPLPAMTYTEAAAMTYAEAVERGADGGLSFDLPAFQPLWEGSDADEEVTA